MSYIIEINKKYKILEFNILVINYFFMTIICSVNLNDQPNLKVYYMCGFIQLSFFNE
jgi:hypothetical protein